MERWEITLIKWQLWLTLLCVALALLAAPLGAAQASVAGVGGMLVAALGILAIASVQTAMQTAAPVVQRLLMIAFYWLRRPAFLLCPLIVAAFFLVFEPVHVPQAGPDRVQDLFVFRSSDPLVERGPEMMDKLEEKRNEINQQLLDEGPREAEWLDRVELPNPNTVRVKVIALTDEESQAYQGAVMQILKKQYPALTEAETEQPKQPREGEQPLLALGRLEFYQPKPHINLGLDLKGGTQIVLQCLPSTTYPFEIPEDQPPFYQPEGTLQERMDRASKLEDDLQEYLEQATTYPFQAGAQQPFYEAGDTAEERPPEADQLEKQLQAHLAEKAFPEWSFARVVSPELIEIAATPENDDEAAQQADMLKQYFAEHLPQATMGESSGFPVRCFARVISPVRIEISTRTGTKEEAERHARQLEGYFSQRFPQATMGETEELLLEEDTGEKVKNIIDRRIDAHGTIEATIEVQGRDRLIVEIPETGETERLIDLIDKPALLEFKLVPKEYQLEIREAAAAEDEAEVRVWHRGSVETGAIVTEDQVMSESQRVLVGRELKPGRKHLYLVPDDKAPGKWAVRFELREDRKRDFHATTRKAVGQYMAILLDRKVVMAPVIESALPGQGVITGKFEEEEALDLKALLTGGALPVPIEVALRQTIHATLGADTVHKSIRAGILGLCMVVLFMLGYYRLPGLLADVALAVYILLVLGVYSFIGAALTLPGIAALVLSVGMAVDANIIIFERLKEELATQKVMRSAVEAGFSRAWTAILDANVTTLIVAVVLYYVGNQLGLSPMRAFAVTLSIGIVCSLFTAITVTRLFLNLAITSPLAERRWLFRTGMGA